MRQGWLISGSLGQSSSTVWTGRRRPLCQRFPSNVLRHRHHPVSSQCPDQQNKAKRERKGRQFLSKAKGTYQLSYSLSRHHKLSFTSGNRALPSTFATPCRLINSAISPTPSGHTLEPVVSGTYRCSFINHGGFSIGYDIAQPQSHRGGVRKDEARE